jgi:hypothetical protein
LLAGSSVTEACKAVFSIADDAFKRQISTSSRHYGTPKNQPSFARNPIFDKISITHFLMRKVSAD